MVQAPTTQSLDPTQSPRFPSESYALEAFHVPPLSDSAEFWAKFLQTQLNQENRGVLHGQKAVHLITLQRLQELLTSVLLVPRGCWSGNGAFRQVLGNGHLPRHHAPSLACRSTPRQPHHHCRATSDHLRANNGKYSSFNILQRPLPSPEQQGTIHAKEFIGTQTSTEQSTLQLTARFLPSYVLPSSLCLYRLNPLVKFCFLFQKHSFRNFLFYSLWFFRHDFYPRLQTPTQHATHPSCGK